MRLGAVKFLNAYPLYWGLKFEPKVDIIKDIPSRLADDLFRNELDLAIISSIEYHKHRDLFNYYDDLCIAAKGTVESIRLYMSPTLGTTSQQSIDQIKTWLGKQHKLRIYYDIATRSSLSMLKVLLNEHCPGGKNIDYEFVQIAPPFEQMIQNLGEQELVLLIGDSALKLKNLPSIDLGDFYFKTFQRAFVYAIWVYRPENGSKAKDILLNAYEIGQNNFDLMIKDAICEFNFSEEFTRHYLTNVVQYRFTTELKDDLVFFYNKFDQLNF
ncbi:MAG: hypothetical protein OEV78_07190 [Spirochaetia bacterium]|nr:hypothetical protein [Spirochaetia bacterium]